MNDIFRITALTLFLLAIVSCSKTSDLNPPQGLPAADSTSASSTVDSYCSGSTLTNAPFGGGAGTPASPWTICTASQLNNVRTQLSGYFLLKTSVDLTGISFQPIGDRNRPFAGSFDGGKNSILGWTVSSSSTQDVGLFGAIRAAVIKNVSLEKFNVSGGTNVGMLVGYVKKGGRSSISSCAATGKVKGINAGGLIGNSDGPSTLTKNYVVADVAGTNSENLGGLIGVLGQSSQLSVSYALGFVRGEGVIGGLVGIARGASIKNTYAGVKVGSPEMPVTAAGGLVGYLSAQSTLANSFSIGLVTGLGNLGGLVGSASSDSTTSSSYWDTQTTKLTQSAQGTGGTTKELKSQVSYSEWDFVNTWTQSFGNYPTLKALTPKFPIGAFSDLGNLEDLLIKKAVRIWGSELLPILDNLTTTNFHKDPTNPLYQVEFWVMNDEWQTTALNRARSMGIRAVPSMGVIGASKDILFTKDYWQNLSTTLLAESRLRAPEDPWMGFDIESYGASDSSEVTYEVLKNYGLTLLDLQQLMEPFLEVIRTEKILPAIHPGNLQDAVMQMLFLASNGGEFWDEGIFGCAGLFRSDYGYWLRVLPAQLTNRHLVEATYPNVTYRAGFFENDTLRNWGKPFLSDAAFLYGQSIWIYPLNKGNSSAAPGDLSYFGTSNWSLGLTKDSRNNVAFGWHDLKNTQTDLRSQSTLPEWYLTPSGQEVAHGYAGREWNSHPEGLLFSDGDIVRLYPSTLTADRPLTFLMNLRADAGTYPILGSAHRQAGYRSYQLSVANGILRLTVWNSSSIATMLENPTPIRTVNDNGFSSVLFWLGNGEIGLSVDGVEVAQAFTDPFRVYDFFTIGYGGMEGTQEWVLATRLLLRDMTVWNRILSPVERSRPGTYPFGF